MSSTGSIITSYVTMTLMVLTLPRVSSSSTIVSEWVLGRNCMVGSSVGSWGTLSSWFSSSSSFSVAVWEPDVLNVCVCVVHCYIYMYGLSHLFPTSLICKQWVHFKFYSFTLAHTHRQITIACEVLQKEASKYIWSYCAYHTPEVWALNMRMPAHNRKTKHSKYHFLCCVHAFWIWHTPWYSAWAWRKLVHWRALHSHPPAGPPHSPSICEELSTMISILEKTDHDA